MMCIGKSHAVVLPLVAALAMSSRTSVAYAQAAPVAPGKAVLIHRVLQLTKAAEVAVTAMENAIPAQRAANPRIPREFWDEFAARARREARRFVDMLVHVYDVQFTTAELEQLVRFYESPLGRRLMEKQPLITQQSMQVGQQWGTQLGAQIAQDLARRGIEMPRP